jgi:hypothetical protein
MKHKHHIVPKYMGGTDDPSNLIELTIEEHAEAHRILYETYGNWQDKLAWQGLAKIITKKELVEQLISHVGKDMKANALRGEKHFFYGKKRPEHSKKMKDWAKTYVRTEEHKKNLKNAVIKSAKENPNRSINWNIKFKDQIMCVENLKKFCRDNDVVYSTLYTRGKSNGCELIGKT